jgi:phosphatidylglycerol:prolipoprotein diacylglycerol transferase
MHPIIAIGRFYIYTYTVTGFLGVASGLAVMVFADKRLKGLRQDLFFCALYALIGGFLGAKILYIIALMPQIIRDPGILLRTLSGGTVFYGGVIGGILGVMRYTHRFRMPFWRFIDCAAAGIPLGQLWGRIGCFMAGCCYGKPTESFLGVTYPECSLAAPPGVPLHPVPLYEAGFNLILFLILLFLLPRNHKPGRIAGVYLIAYGTVRPVFDCFRGDHDRFFFIISFAISVLLCILGVSLLTGFMQKRLFPDEEMDKKR